MSTSFNAWQRDVVGSSIKSGDWFDFLSPCMSGCLVTHVHQQNVVKCVCIRAEPRPLTRLPALLTLLGPCYPHRELKVVLAHWKVKMPVGRGPSRSCHPSLGHLRSASPSCPPADHRCMNGLSWEPGAQPRPAELADQRRDPRKIRGSCFRRLNFRVVRKTSWLWQ